jgi:manganese/zinc/iron transport system permease protein
VSSFEAVGSVLVVALMIAPPAAAYLLTDRLPVMLLLGVIIGIASAISGYFLARTLNASIAGSMATMTGILFVLVLLLAPRRGLVSRWLRHRRQRWQFAGEILLVHLSNHEGTPVEKQECTLEHLTQHMKWHPTFGRKVARYLARHGLADRVNGSALTLTEQGRVLAHQVMLR